MRKHLLFLFFCTVLPLFGEEMKINFPRFTEVKPPILLKPYPTLSIDRDGNWLVNGHLRYLLGAQVPSLFGRDGFRPIPRHHAPEFNWLYDRAPDYQAAQRVGFDTLCMTNPVGWIKELFPEFQYSLIAPSADGFPLEPGLPVLMDYTCAPWSNGRPANAPNTGFHHPELAGKLPDDAIVPPSDQVWMPYSIFHPEGRKMYRAMWVGAAKFARNWKTPILAYELFNEPMYNDKTPYARKVFAESLRRKYGSVNQMNRRYRVHYRSFEEASQRPNLKENRGLFVDYLKFLEDGFLDLCTMGREAIREVDSDARTCIQLKGLWHYRTICRSAANLYKLNSINEIVTVSTGGGLRFSGASKAPKQTVAAPSNPLTFFDGVMERHFYRALADGKPMQNQEMYAGRTYADILSNLWLDHVRGSNATYLFDWTSGAVHWHPFNEEGGRKLAESRSYNLLNPYNVPTSELPAIHQAKREIFRFAEFFLPRDRNVKRDIAVLFSYPTERVSGVTGENVKVEFVNYGGALEFSHYPIDVLLEEQLAEGRQNRYRAIVAAGIRAVYPETAERLLEFVRGGGTLIVGREFMQEDEYGFPVDWQGVFDGLKYTDHQNAPISELHSRLPRPELLRGTVTIHNIRRISSAPGWEVFGSDGENPVLLHKTLGRGGIWLVTAAMPDYATASVLGSILRREKLVPPVLLSWHDRRDLPVNVELHAAHREGKTAYFLYNWDTYPKLISLESDMVTRYGYAMDPICRRSLPIVDGRVMLLLPPRRRTLLLLGDRNLLADDYGKCTPVGKDDLLEEYRAAVRKKSRASSVGEEKRYFPDPAQTVPLNLRTFANSPFFDPTAPEDGRGGWTDQGRGHSLTGVPWDIHNFLGVPCELIRPDDNNNLTCIVLKSRSSAIPFPERIGPIPVNNRLKSLFFFHAAAWVPKEKVKAMDYVIHYASGKKLSIPVMANENIWDWYSIRTVNLPVAWKNREENGFYCWQWINPEPENEIRAIELVSAGGPVIPIVIGITAEFADPAVRSTPLKGFQIYGWSGIAGVIRDGVVTASITPSVKAYSGFVLTFPGRMIPKELSFQGELRFEIQAGTDLFGGRKSTEFEAVSFNQVGNKGKAIWKGKRLPLKQFLPEKKLTEQFQQVSIPLAQLGTEEQLKTGNQLSFRFAGLPEAGVVIRNLRIVTPR